MRAGRLVLIAAAATVLLATPAHAARPKLTTLQAPSIAGPNNAGIFASPTNAPRERSGELIVRFKRGTSAAEREGIHGRNGAKQLRFLGLSRTYLVSFDRTRKVDAQKRSYERESAVQYASPNYVRHLDSTFPNDTNLAEQWGLHNSGQTANAVSGTPDADIDAPEAWDATTGSSQAVVGVVDTGVDYANPDLAPNIWANPGETGGGKETNGIDDDANGRIDDFRGWDFVSNDNNPTDGSGQGHGTHMASVIGARGNNALGTSGVTWNARLAPLRACDPDPLIGCDDAFLIAAFTYAGQKGMKVVNASLSGQGFSLALSDAIATYPGTLFVVSAGNGGADLVGDDNDTTPQYPCGYDPANIVCVAATDANDGLASFSDYGASSVDLAAPGTNVLGSWLGNQLAYLGGTSPAAGLVSGAAALVLARDPTRTTSQLKADLLTNVDAKPSLSGKTVTGGRLNARNSLPFLTPPAGHGGDLETSFDGDGIRTLSFTANSNDQAKAVAVQPDGKIVTVGEANTSGGTDTVFTVARYNPDGSLDTSFSGDGMQTTDVTVSTQGDSANAVAIQPDGRIVVAGDAANQFAVARYNVNGSLDTSFSGDGMQTTDYGLGSERAYGVTVQPDGKVVLAGVKGLSHPSDFALARYLVNGSLDTSFGTGGLVTTDFGAVSDEAKAVTIQPDGKLLAAGATDADASEGVPQMLAVARYNTNGGLDTTFSGDGRQTTDIEPNRDASNPPEEANAIAVQRDGKIVAGGQVPSFSGTPNRFAVVRYRADGTLDPSFGGGSGFTTADLGTSFTNGYGMVIQPDGQIVVAGKGPLGARTDVALVRWDLNGAGDPRFGTSGFVQTACSNGSSANGVALQPDGNIVVAGTCGTDNVVQRYNGAAPHVSASPDADLNPAGQSITVNGTGWLENSTVNVRQCRDAGAVNPACVLLTNASTSSANGSFSVTVNVQYTTGAFASCEDPFCRIQVGGGGNSTVRTPISFNGASSTVGTPSAGAISQGQSMALGQAVADTASVTGSSGGGPSGTVTYYACGPIASPATCEAGTQVGSPKTLTPGAGGSATATSDPFTPGAVGRYCFRAVYSGDSSHRSSTDSSKGQCVSVSQPAAAIVATDDYYRLPPTVTSFIVPGPGVLQNDLGPAGEPLTATLLTGPAHGDLVSGLQADGSFTYAPDSGYTGPDEFTYRAQGTSGTSDAIARIDVTAANDTSANRSRANRSRANRSRTLDEAQLVTYADCRARYVSVNPQVTLSEDTFIQLSAALYDAAGQRIATSEGYLAYGEFFADFTNPLVLAWPSWSSPAPVGGAYVEVLLEANPGDPDAYNVTATVPCRT